LPASCGSHNKQSYHSIWYVIEGVNVVEPVTSSVETIPFRIDIVHQIFSAIVKHPFELAYRYDTENQEKEKHDDSHIEYIGKTKD
jgi:hypothetical protein